MNQKQKTVLKRIVAAAIVYIAAAAAKKMNVFAGMPQPWTELVVFLIPYLIIGWDIVYKAFRGIKNGQVFDENFLMTVATFGAFGVGEFSEAVAVMLFYQVGEWFQSYAVGKSRRNISELMDIRPVNANVDGRQSNPGRPGRGGDCNGDPGGSRGRRFPLTAWWWWESPP